MSVTSTILSILPAWEKDRFVYITCLASRSVSGSVCGSFWGSWKCWGLLSPTFSVLQEALLCTHSPNLVAVRQHLAWRVMGCRSPGTSL